jgi:hypothetical protein
MLAKQKKLVIVPCDGLCTPYLNKAVTKKLIANLLAAVLV